MHPPVPVLGSNDMVVQSLVPRSVPKRTTVDEVYSALGVSIDFLWQEMSEGNPIIPREQQEVLKQIQDTLTEWSSGLLPNGHARI
ncbi:hypothetical protein NMY22_g19621 [Coprinellus aureogranulatus]|nr:hypothetical protein NMY22_g19621 [Coprinellus aureogranulatus]